jgi:hypothetical protein
MFGIHKQMPPSVKFGGIIAIILLVNIVLVIVKYDFMWLEKLKAANTAKLFTLSIAISIPVTVWCLTSLITTKNLIKQHSMNVLLQTRTSAEYTKHAQIASAVLHSSNEISNEERVSIIYILNFIEFVAIGIKRNDLDEAIFKDAWKGMIARTVEFHGDGIIAEAQLNTNKDIWKHIIWLNKRWQKSTPCISFYHLLEIMFVLLTIPTIACIFLVILVKIHKYLL